MTSMEQKREGDKRDSKFRIDVLDLKIDKKIKRYSNGTQTGLRTVLKTDLKRYSNGTQTGLRTVLNNTTK